MLDAAKTESLLSKLCIELGFCLPPEKENRLIKNPPKTIDDFTDAVFRAEGLNPEYAERHLYRQVRNKVAEAFEKHRNDDYL
jgi:hypothetical protein